MASEVPTIERPNLIAIPAMRDPDILRTREYYITILMKARMGNDSDTIKAAIDWIVELTKEMRFRGGKHSIGGRRIIA